MTDQVWWGKFDIGSPPRDHQITNWQAFCCRNHRRLLTWLGLQMAGLFRNSFNFGVSCWDVFSHPQRCPKSARSEATWEAPLRDVGKLSYLRIWNELGVDQNLKPRIDGLSKKTKILTHTRLRWLKVSSLFPGATVSDGIMGDNSQAKCPTHTGYPLVVKHG